MMKTHRQEDLTTFTTHIMLKRLEDQVYALQKTCDKAMVLTCLDPAAKMFAQLAREASEFKSEIDSVPRTGADDPGSCDPYHV